MNCRWSRGLHLPHGEAAPRDHAAKLILTARHHKADHDLGFASILYIEQLAGDRVGNEMLAFRVDAKDRFSLPNDEVGIERRRVAFGEQWYVETAGHRIAVPKLARLVESVGEVALRLVQATRPKAGAMRMRSSASSRG